MSKKTLLAGALIVLAVGSLAAYFMGYLYIGIKSPNQRVSVNRAEAGCGEAMLNRYNAVALPLSQSGESTIKALASEIEGIADSKNDATCQTILFASGNFVGDKAMATSAYDRVKALHAQGLYANSLLHNVPSVGAMKDALAAMEG